ncbi:Mitochondrial copper homeostasis protein [Actinomortierella ambigua]|uniref:Mitochondrial copper homeostasis protein n=1 Tax=Actinomortierella ambigua TaxID=1343610 RepID=A0A9P6PSV8_9FUNG|nr:Mitochondrial copper homeostasis protein [Actinomortierella ambigua]
MAATSADSTQSGPQTDENPSLTSRQRHERHVPLRVSENELKQFNKEYTAKSQSQFMDPCAAQTKASYKCLSDHNFDKRKCTQFFKDYSDCKKKWLASLREQRRKKNLGIVDDDDEQ